MYSFLAHGLFALSAAQSPDSLTIEAALARARAARPRIFAASAQVERARGAARLGAMIPNPTAQFEVDRDTPTHKITASQSLAWLPRHAAERAAGRFLVERARADSVQVLADVTREVRRAFFGALAAGRHSVLAAEQSALADSLARLASRRASAGDISDLERDQVVVEASRARLSAWQAREDSDVATAELGRALAWPGTRGPLASGPLDEGLTLTPAALRDTSRATTDPPAVRSAIADSAAAAHRLRAARIARVPFPGLVLGREWGGGSSGNFIVGVALPIPLFSTGGEAVQQARGEASVQAALAAETRLGVRAQLEAARTRAEQSAGRALFARDSLLPEARRVRAGAVRLYEEGRTSVLPVLDALRTERDVTRLTVVELLAYQQARADLDAVLGRAP